MWECCDSRACSFYVAAIFSVLCYNVLCDKYCTRQMYGYCPVWALNWEYRKKGIMDDIRSLNGDIISLQVSQTLISEGAEGIREAHTYDKSRWWVSCTAPGSLFHKYIVAVRWRLSSM